MSGPTRVLLVDDHRVLTGALRRLLTRLLGIACAGEAQSGEEAVSLAAQVHPDVVVMDLAMPGIGGIEATRRIVREHPSTKVVVLSGAREPADVDEAMAAGAIAFVDKTDGFDSLIEALRALTAPTGTNILSERERQVLGRIAEGATMRQVAEELGISQRTAETYRERVKRNPSTSSVG